MPTHLRRATLVTLLCCSTAHAAPPPRAWLKPLRVFDGPIWFDDERAVIEQAIAVQLTTGPQPIDVIPVAEVRALRADALAGRVPGREVACPVAAVPEALTAWTYPDADVVGSTARCADGTCVLTVTIVSSDTYVEIERWEAVLLADGTPASWAAAIDHGALRRIPTPTRAVVGGVRGGALWSGGRPVATLRDVATTGAWSLPLSSSSVTRVAPALWACEQQAVGPARDNWSQPFVVEVGADGHVDRCESAYPDHLAPPERPCQCEVLRTVDLGSGATGRRATFELVVDGGAPRPKVYTGHRAVSFAGLHATDGSALLSPVGLDHGLTTCLDTLDPTLALDVKAAMSAQVGPDGRVTKARLTWPGGLPRAVRACLQAGVEARQFDCPRSGEATVTGAVVLRVQPR